MVFKFGIFSGGVERFADSQAQSLTQPSKEPSTMFKFESSKVRPVVDLPLNLGTQPQSFGTQSHATFSSTSEAPRATGSGAGSKIPIGEVPNTKGYRRLVELQRHFMKNDGLYVWQKMGARDKAVNMFCLVGSIFGTLVVFYEIKKEAYKNS